MKKSKKEKPKPKPRRVWKINPKTRVPKDKKHYRRATFKSAAREEISKTGTPEQV